MVHVRRSRRTAAAVTLFLLMSLVSWQSPVEAQDVELQPSAGSKALPVPAAPSTSGIPKVLRSSKPRATTDPAIQQVDELAWPIHNLANEKCIVVRGSDNESTVVKTDCSLDFLDQYWTFVPVALGYYQLRNSNSGKCLVVRGNVHNTPAIQYTCDVFVDQHWMVLEDASGHYFMLQNRSSGLCLVLRSSENNARGVNCEDQHVDQWWRRGMPTSPLSYNSMTKPTYFVHGYSDNGHGFDANGSYWREARRIFAFSGPIGRGWTYCYYSVDTNCDLLVPGDRNEPIKQLGADFAWEIYDHFSKFRVAVDVVGHSMGGLIARAALTGVNKGDPAFPPYLYVEDAVTIASPHGGVPLSTFPCSILGCPTQVQDMRNGSPFLTWLEETPEGATGTQWTLIGLHDDRTVPARSAIQNGKNSHHKVVYDNAQFPDRTAHMDILWITTGAYNTTRCDYYLTECTISDMNTFVPWAEDAPLWRAAYASYWVHTD